MWNAQIIKKNWSIKLFKITSLSCCLKLSHTKSHPCAFSSSFVISSTIIITHLLICLFYFYTFFVCFITLAINNNILKIILVMSKVHKIPWHTTWHSDVHISLPCQPWYRSTDDVPSAGELSTDKLFVTSYYLNILSSLYHVVGK